MFLKLVDNVWEVCEYAAISASPCPHCSVTAQRLRSERWFLRGFVHDVCHQHEAVARCMHRCLELDPMRPDAWSLGQEVSNYSIQTHRVPERSISNWLFQWIMGWFSRSEQKKWMKMATVCMSFLKVFHYISQFIYMSYGQNLVHGERTSLSRVGPYRFCSGGTLYKPSWGYRFRVGPYRFCSDGYPTTLSILLWSYLILSDTHIYI